MAESEDKSTTEGDDTYAIGEEVLHRLVLPTAALILAILYVDSVHGRISWQNLRYPYFVIAVLVTLALTIYTEEIIEIVKTRKEEKRPPFADSVTARVKEWRRSIALAVFGFIYLWLIDILGFFVSSALLMVSIMAVSGMRDYRKVVLITAAVLAGVRLFTNFLNMTPPEGMFL